MTEEESKQYWNNYNKLMEEAFKPLGASWEKVTARPPPGFTPQKTTVPPTPQKVEATDKEPVKAPKAEKVAEPTKPVSETLKSPTMKEVVAFFGEPLT
jgi:hypothetical protein